MLGFYQDHIKHHIEFILSSNIKILLYVSSATKVKSRQRKLDWKELEKDVKQNPESSVVRQS